MLKKKSLKTKQKKLRAKSVENKSLFFFPFSNIMRKKITFLTHFTFCWKKKKNNFFFTPDVYSNIFGINNFCDIFFCLKIFFRVKKVLDKNSISKVFWVWKLVTKFFSAPTWSEIFWNKFFMFQIFPSKLIISKVRCMSVPFLSADLMS